MNLQSKAFTPRIIIQMLFFIVIIPLFPLLITWQWDWWEAWVYAAFGILGFIISRALVARRHPDLLAERARFTQQADAKPWDKLLAPLVGLGGGLIPLAAGLDVLLSGGLALGLPVKIAAITVIFAGYMLGSYALLENRFFSGMVRIQTERDHHVISSGPYRWMRHPGYAGALLTYLATPFLLDSAWAFLAVAFLTTVLVIRTRLEDTTLQAELPGYHEYAQRVRYRLLPGIW